jgi:hypothetical protein
MFAQNVVTPVGVLSVPQSAIVAVAKGDVSPIL